MASDFDSLFADDTPVTPQEQSWGGFDYWKLLENQPQQAPQQPMPPQQMPGIPTQPMMPGFPSMPQPPMWWMGWDNNMFISSQNDYQVATSRGAFGNAMRNDPWAAPMAWISMVDNQPKRSFSETLKYFWDINKKIYASFNVIQLIFIIVGMGIAAYLIWLLKNFLVYIILYNVHYLSFFEALQPLVIFIGYALIVIWIFEFLDWNNDKGRETLLSPFKWWLVGIWVLYLGNIIEFDQLFSIFYVFLLPLIFVKLFCFSEKEMPADATTQAVAPVWVMQTPEVNPAEEMIKKWVDALNIELPEQESTELLVEETDDEIEIYDLGAEMITASKQRWASAFVLTNRGNISNPKIFYIDIDTETEMFAE